MRLEEDSMGHKTTLEIINAEMSSSYYVKFDEIIVEETVKQVKARS